MENLFKAKIVTRNGVPYYADGKNAGKRVGSVRQKGKEKPSSDSSKSDSGPDEDFGKIVESIKIQEDKLNQVIMNENSSQWVKDHQTYEIKQSLLTLRQTAVDMIEKSPNVNPDVKKMIGSVRIQERKLEKIAKDDTMTDWAKDKEMFEVQQSLLTLRQTIIESMPTPPRKEDEIKAEEMDARESEIKEKELDVKEKELKVKEDKLKPKKD